MGSTSILFLLTPKIFVSIDVTDCLIVPIYFLDTLEISFVIASLEDKVNKKVSFCSRALAQNTIFLNFELRSPQSQHYLISYKLNFVVGQNFEVLLC